MTLAADTAHPRHTNWKTIAAEALAGTGVHASRPVHANLTAPALVAEAVRRDEGRLSVDGALVVTTGVHTGRSARDKFVVDEPSVTDEVWWGRINNRLPPEKFAVLKARVQAYLQGQELFTQDLYAGADPAHRVRVRMVTTGAWQALFSRNIFIRPRPEELADFEPDYIILHAPHFQTDPAIDGVRSGTSIALSFEQRIIVIAGSEYAGEVKKSIFTVMNWILPERGVMPMHCSANIGGEGDVALFFGLSGTGKTTLSSDPHRRLIGDDEHGWSENGVFNFEGGCYAKVINLSAEHEPEIWAASHRFGLPGVHRLEGLGREDLLDHPVFDVADVERVRLRDHALNDRIRNERRHLQGEAQIGLGLLGDLVESRHAGAALAQHDVLVVLRPDHRRADHAAADRRTRKSSCSLEDLAASPFTSLAVRLASHLHASLFF